MSAKVNYIHDGEWAQVSLGGLSLMVYPREDGTYSIGRPTLPQEYHDLKDQVGFIDMRVAIENAINLVENPDVLRVFW